VFTLLYIPSSLTVFQPGWETAVKEYLLKNYPTLLRVVRHKKEDLKLANHLLGHRRLYLQPIPRNVQNLLGLRKELLTQVAKNKEKRGVGDAYKDIVRAEATAAGAGGMEVGFDDGFFSGRKGKTDTGPPAGPRGVYHRHPGGRRHILSAHCNQPRNSMRVVVRRVLSTSHRRHHRIPIQIHRPRLSPTTLPHRIKPADPIVVAYDIETTKSPLRFSDSAFDRVIMISYMIDGQGYLIVYCEIVSAGIEDFKYSAREGYEGPFMIFNVANEEETIT
jgi:DNA polymerase epsilon subunit 1